MADECDDSKFSLKSSTKTFSSVIEYIGTLNIPNFFVLPEYNGTGFDMKSPPFEYANATWRLKFFRAMCGAKDDRSFDVYLLAMNSKIGQEAIICTIDLLDAYGEKYRTRNRAFILEEEDENDDDDDDDDDDDALYIDVDVLSHDFKKLFLNGKNHDLTLKVADKEFRVHQDILMVRSPVFQAMLTHDMTEKNKGVIDIPDCDPQAMEQFLFYIYSGKVETLNQDNALGLYYAADKYNMTLLKEECTEYIKKSLTPSIICGVIQLALNHSDSDLLEHTTDYFLDHTREIFPTLEWMSFLKTNSVAANELLIKASEKWSNAK